MLFPLILLVPALSMDDSDQQCSLKALQEDGKLKIVLGWGRCISVGINRMELSQLEKSQIYLLKFC